MNSVALPGRIVRKAVPGKEALGMGNIGYIVIAAAAVFFLWAVSYTHLRAHET